jgi:predicted metal-dependent hydrolase
VSSSGSGKRGLCGNLYDNWSDLLCLAIYVPGLKLSFRLDAGASEFACANRRSHRLHSLHGLPPVQTATKMCGASDGDAVHRQVSWLVPQERTAVSQPPLPLPESRAMKGQARRARRPTKSKTQQLAGKDSSPTVEVRRSSRRTRTVTAYRERDTIVVLIPQRMSKADEQTFVRDMVEKVLAREARATAPRSDEALALRAQQLAATYLMPALDQMPEPAGVFWVTNQQQRWGSCTPSTRLIRLSHRLQPMPSWVVDYVLLHELAHLVEPVHSEPFWSLVNRYPEAEKAKGYLEGYLAGEGRPADESDVD